MRRSSHSTSQHQVEHLGPKAGERAITGTGADLRRLSMEDSKRQLMAMGMSEEEVARAQLLTPSLLAEHENIGVRSESQGFPMSCSWKPSSSSSWQWACGRTNLQLRSFTSVWIHVCVH